MIFFVIVNGYYQLPINNGYKNQILIKFDLIKLVNNVYVPQLIICNCYLNDATVIYPSNIEINAPNGLQTTALMIFSIDRPIYLGEIKKRFNIFISSLFVYVKLNKLTIFYYSSSTTGAPTIFNFKRSMPAESFQRQFILYKQK